MLVLHRQETSARPSKCSVSRDFEHASALVLLIWRKKKKKKNRRNICRAPIIISEDVEMKKGEGEGRGVRGGG